MNAATHSCLNFVNLRRILFVLLILVIILPHNASSDRDECRNPSAQRTLRTTDRCYANVTSVDFWSDLLESVWSKLYVNEISENLETIEQHILTDLYESVRRILPETFRERSDLIRHLREKTAESRRRRQDKGDSLLDRIARHFNVGGVDRSTGAYDHRRTTDSHEDPSTSAMSDSKKSSSPSRIPNNCATRFAVSRQRNVPLGELFFVNDVAEMWGRNAKLQELFNRVSSESGTEGKSEAQTVDAPASTVAGGQLESEAATGANRTLKEQPAATFTVCYATIFYLSHCPFSRELLATLELVARRYVPAIPIFAIDAERSARHWNTKFGVVCVPTLFVFEDRRAVAKYNLSTYNVDDVVEWLSSVVGYPLTPSRPHLSDADGDVSNGDESESAIYSSIDLASELHAIDLRLTELFGQLSSISAVDSTLCLAWLTVLFVALVSFLRSTYGAQLRRRASVLFVKLHVSVRDLLKG